jgi:hypothetical protein
VLLSFGMLLIVRFLVVFVFTSSSLVLPIEVLLLQLDFVWHLTFYFFLHAACVFFHLPPVDRLRVELYGTFVVLSHTAC